MQPFAPAHNISEAAGDSFNKQPGTAKMEESKLSMIVPFFSWELSTPLSSPKLQDTKEEQIFEILNEIDKAVSSTKLGTYHSKIPEFTEEEFTQRQEFLIQHLHDDNLTTTNDQSLGTLSHDKALMRQLVETSRQIMLSFVPKVGSSTVHTLLKRFWGCVDMICRVRNRPSSYIHGSLY